MRKFLLSLLLLVVFSPLALRADEVLVGTLDSTSPTAVLPFRNSATDCYTQSIYPKELVGGAMTITAVSFSCNTQSEETTSNVKIYVGETDKTSHTSTPKFNDWVQDLTLVYEGEVTLGGEEWENFTFNKAYNYSGTKNLVIAVSSAGTAKNSNLKWNVITPTGTTKLSMRNGGYYSTPSGINGTEGASTIAVVNYIPYIKLTTLSAESTLSAPVVSANATSATTILLEWEAVENAEEYLIYFEGEQRGKTTATSYLVDECEPEKEQCFTVVAVKGELKSEASEPACAITPEMSILPEQPNVGETITIGATSDLQSSYLPIINRYSFGLTQQIYTAEEINFPAGTITSISFRSKYPGASEREIAVYLTNTDKEYYTGSYDWITLTATDSAAYEGTVVTPSVAGWFTIYFTRPFEYTGGNLAVTVNDITGGYESYDDWYAYPTGKTETSPRSLYSIGYNAQINHLNLEDVYGSFDVYNYGTYKDKDEAYINSQVRFTIIPAPASVEAPESIALGNVVLGEYWSERIGVKANVKALNTSITNITVDNSFFVLSEIEYPTTSAEFTVSYDRNAAAGEHTGNLVISYADTTVLVPMTANAYTAATPDVFELAQEVTFTENAFEHTPVFANLHDSYLLPQEYVDGNAPDAVYAVEFDDDVLVTANVTGTKAKLAVYKSDFNGEAGPSANNYYDGILYTPRSFSFDFENGTMKGWTLIDNDGDGYNWIVEEVDGNKYVRSYGEKTEGTGESEVTVITGADNKMMTEQLYNITANSKLSFDASRYSIGDESFDNSETYKKYIRVEVSKDGESFTMIEKVLPNPGVLTNVVVDLGAKFAELGLNYGDYYIALYHKENGLFVSVDNVKLANVISAKTETKTIESIHFPAGKYYFIAAAETEFSINITKEAAPLTPPTDIFATDITTTSVMLSWNAVNRAESYNIYKGETLLANVKETEYLVEGLTPYTEYSFVIKTVAGGNESFASEAAVVKTKDLIVGMPSNLVANVKGSSSVALTWNGAENALSYNVYEGSANNARKIATVTMTTYTVSGLEANTPYYFAVAAVRNDQESEKTASVMAITEDLIPSAPYDLKATTFDATSIGLTWEAGQNATAYNIYRDGVKVAESTGLLYVDRGLIQGTEYCYTVKGVRGVVESKNESNQACATTGGVKPTAPVAPTNLLVTGLSTTSVKLVWGAVGNASSYKVYQGEVNIATVELPTFTVEGLTIETEYCFTVSAVNEIGESEKSAESCGMTLGDGVEELISAFNIYPNPVNDKLYIETEVEIEEVSIFDVYGRQQVNMTTGQQVDVANLNSGVYFVMIKTNEGVVTKRFVKK